MKQKIYTRGQVWIHTGLAAAFILLLTWVVPAMASEPATGQKTFGSPQEAVQVLADAVRADDPTALTAIFGTQSEDLISSGDPVADAKSRERFLHAYMEKNRIEQPDSNTAVLHVGEKDYPFPIPLVKQDNGWVFDTLTGKEEILNRRIGKNELRTIEVLHAYVDAQREYAASDRNGNCIAEFAQKLISSDDKNDGLYWPTAEGEEESPFGPLIAGATVEGYSGNLDSEDPEPFHGYLFKILTSQGDHAKGGAFDYVVNGDMILGFGMVAYPAKYGVSGVMTFIVNQEGVIYQKDLGDKTPEAANMVTFDPDDTWSHCDDEESDQ